MEVRRTMKAMSVKERETRTNLEFMIPMGIPGRYQLLTKLKDMTIGVNSVVVRPIKSIPSVIRNTIGFFSTDGYWEGSFIAYGTDLRGRHTVLWDDFGIPTIKREPNTVITDFIKERLSSDNEIILVTAKERQGSCSLEFYYYLP